MGSLVQVKYQAAIIMGFQKRIAIKYARLAHLQIPEKWFFPVTDVRRYIYRESNCFIQANRFVENYFAKPLLTAEKSG